MSGINPGALVDITGRRFGRLVVLGRDPTQRRERSAHWFCRCDCGVEKSIRGKHLRSGFQFSCGCWRREFSRLPRNTRVGKTRAPSRKRDPLYAVWVTMKARCSRPTIVSYPRYGGRGISVCERWSRSFANFLADMGPRPPGMSIDRIDNNGNYEPGNCRWATPTEQANNKRHIRYIEWGGKRQTCRDWDRELGFRLGVVLYRLKSGWSVERALTVPVAGKTRSEGQS